MLCPRCHTEMQIVIHITDNGKNETETQHRCIGCWYHKTEIKKKENGT